MSTTLTLPTNKKTANLTPEQRRALFLKQLEKQQRLTLSDFSTWGKIHNWMDFQKSAGIVAPTEVLSKPVSVESIREVFEIVRKEVEAGPSAIIAPPTEVQAPIPAPLPIPIEPELPDIEDEFSEIVCLRNSERGVIYNKQQEKAAAWIVRALMKHNYKGIAFPWPVGSGKTYVIGAVLVELWRRKWKPLVESMSLYPAAVITRASIVFQTEEVLRDGFGLELGRDVDVTNIDQLRGKFGKNFIKEGVKVVQGNEIYTYDWIPPLAPAILVLDEAQSVKNIDSTQSQIMQAFNELDEEDHRMIQCSATLFSRVIESKVFAVSTRLEW